MGFSVQVYSNLVCPKDREQIHKALLSHALLVLPINSAAFFVTVRASSLAKLPAASASLWGLWQQQS